MNNAAPIDFGTYEKSRLSDEFIDLDFYEAVANFWRKGVQYQQGAIVRPNRFTGYAYQADQAGGSGDKEPRWPRRIGDQVVDGGITWTCIAAGANGVTSLTAPAVAVTPPQGLTIGSEQVVDGGGTNTAVALQITGGTRGGYDIVVTATAGSETLIGHVRIQVR